jgi:hypothetical protein
LAKDAVGDEELEDNDEDDDEDDNVSLGVVEGGGVVG